MENGRKIEEWLLLQALRKINYIFRFMKVIQKMKSSSLSVTDADPSE